MNIIGYCLLGSVLIVISLFIIKRYKLLNIEFKLEEDGVLLLAASIILVLTWFVTLPAIWIIIALKHFFNNKEEDE